MFCEERLLFHYIPWIFNKCLKSCFESQWVHQAIEILIVLTPQLHSPALSGYIKQNRVTSWNRIASCTPPLKWLSMVSIKLGDWALLSLPRHLRSWPKEIVPHWKYQIHLLLINKVVTLFINFGPLRAYGDIIAPEPLVRTLGGLLRKLRIWLTTMLGFVYNHFLYFSLNHF